MPLTSTHWKKDSATQVSFRDPAVITLQGNAGGLTIIGDTASGGNFFLSSTSHATKGTIRLGSATGLFINEATNAVGIGGTPTSGMLQVINGSIVIDNNTSYRAKDTVGTVETILGLTTANNLTVASPTLGGSIQYSVRSTTGRHAFFVNGTGSLLEKMSISAAGLVGIGNTSPAYPLDVVQSSTATSGTIRGISLATTLAPASNSTATLNALDIVAVTSSGASNPATTYHGSRYLVHRNSTDTGSITTMRGIQLQALNNTATGTGQGAVTATLEGAIFQAFDNSNTTTATTTLRGGNFSASASTNTVATRVFTTMEGGFFQVSLAGGSTLTTITNLNVVNVDCAVTGSLNRTGTITNAVGINLTGFTTSGSFGSGLTYTNVPEQIRLQSMTIAGSMGIRQQGTTPHNRFQGKVMMGADSAPTNDLSFGGASARTIGIERHSTANTAGVNLTVQAGGATSGATNKAGGSITVQPGIGTGTGTPSRVDIQAPAFNTASGTTDQTQVTRIVLNGTANLTTAVATTLITIPLATLQMANGLVLIGIEAADATDVTAYSASVFYSAVNKAGTYTTNSTVSTVGLSSSVASSDTTDGLTVAYSFVNGSNQTQLQITPLLTGMTATTFRLTYQVISHAQQDITAP